MYHTIAAATPQPVGLLRTYRRRHRRRLAAYMISLGGWGAGVGSAAAASAAAGGLI